ncbi:DUF418 domain-containing protein [Hymenobacter coccineus]|uniref:DUF418 domain-containing protein n=1 Tax=Hymenobacter coccineus TaxID=1908235 RepID=A0A1G1SZW4_9BACT|nr:DUF418 domain-containing protein [Hymenobacter coccineus]OGX84146.1 hypothetical protein BEN49_11550 [Hymenobacter coccineus]
MLPTSTFPSAPPAAPPRLEAVDALRGFALLGIWLVHFLTKFVGQRGDGTGPAGLLSAGEMAVRLGIDTFVVGKFFSIFSLLFGLGFALQLRSAGAKGLPYTVRFVWRLALLGAFGWLHRLLFTFEILHAYAVVGLLLVLVYRWRNGWLLLTSALLFVGGLCFAYWLAPATVLFNRVFGEAAGSFLVDEFSGFRVFSIAALFVLGLYLGRRDAFADTPANRVFFNRILVVAAVVFLGLRLAYSQLAAALGASLAIRFYEVFFTLKSLVVSALYVAGLVQLYRQPLLRRALAWLGPLGRMGLTTYVLQSLCLLLFAWYCQHYVGPAPIPLKWVLVAAALLFAAQAAAAHGWLRRFRYGPLEWLWRSATYWQWQPLRRG